MALYMLLFFYIQKYMALLSSVGVTQKFYLYWWKKQQQSEAHVGNGQLYFEVIAFTTFCGAVVRHGWGLMWFSKVDPFSQTEFISEIQPLHKTLKKTLWTTAADEDGENLRSK